MKKLILICFLLLIGFQCRGEMMLVEVKEKRELSDKSFYSLEITLKSINRNKKYFYFLKESSNRFFMSSTLAPNVKLRYNSNRDKNQLEKMNTILPLGLKKENLLKSDEWASFLDWDQVRDLLFKGLDENEFELKSVSEREVTSEESGITINTRSYWFQRVKGKGLPLEYFEKRAKEKVEEYLKKPKL